LIPAALALFLAMGAGIPATAAEIACHQRTVDIASPVFAPAHGPTGAAFARFFRAMNRRYRAMLLAGCSEDQRGRVRILTQITGDLADRAARLPTPLGTRVRSPAASQGFIEFMSRLESFEKRRVVMQEDLARMRRGGR
jgi:hypothetical protein